MADEPNPYEAPAPGWEAPAAAPPPLSAELGEIKHTLNPRLVNPQGAWKLDLHDRHLRFVGPEGEAVAFDRAEFPDKVQFALLGGTGLLTVLVPIRRVFKMTHYELGVLKSWFGSDLEIWLNAMLKKRRKFGWIFAVIVGGLGLLTLDWLLISYGALAGLLFLLSRVAPHRALFLLDAGLTALISIFIANGVYQGTMSYWWGLFFLFALFTISANIRLFSFFSER